ncbi:PF07600 family protein [Leptospira weilii serovar Ranarum str. ICFT]|uniref:PF07600 family protein n=1 Tax=Leptospira weilii serovar Ranarum str. ICFT TaxID=1218598 RepID=N1WGW7_9LEPT|nr:PF07600 family protein [Leptospira weilii serovar Ranarum str. ICFT]
MVNNKLKNETLSSQRTRKITCSFLVPKNFYKRLGLKNQKQIGKNLEFLLKKYRTKILKSRRFHNKTSTSLYQRKRGDLIKLNVRINDFNWEELTLLSRSHGVSNCYLYTLLLNWEYFINAKNPFLNELNKFKNPKITLVWCLDLNFGFSQRLVHILKRFPEKIE